MSLEKFLARQKEITKNLMIQESGYARRYRFYEDDLEPGAEAPAGDVPAAEPAPEAPVDADPAMDPAAGDVPVAEPEMGGDDLAADPGADDMDMSALDAEMGGAPDAGVEDPAAGGGDTEIDVTELVNGTHEVNAKVDAVIQKMDQNLNSINSITQTVAGVETMLNTMHSAINALTNQVELMRPPTEDERRKVVQQNSYPFNQSMSDVQNGMKQTQTDLEKRTDKLSMQNILNTYNQSEIKQSF